MASVRFMDRQVGRLLNTLDSLNIREETIVIFISDHGYNLGEHDCWSKMSLWEGTVRIPMIISYPGNKKIHGTTFDSVAELIDLYPTLTELCGLSSDQPAMLQGKSLSGAVTGDTLIKDRKVAYTITDGGRAGTIRTEGWRYTRWGEDISPGNEELYDHRSDPEELENLAGARKMKKQLTVMREKFEKARENARGDH